VRADFSVRPSGTAAKRRVPYPLIPARVPNRKRSALAVPELVGFLLHPVSRSETWRRLKQLRANFDQSPLARSEKTGPNSLGERVDQEETNYESTTPESILDQGTFLKKEVDFPYDVTSLNSSL
jgi:hypothetical protein